MTKYPSNPSRLSENKQRIGLMHESTALASAARLQPDQGVTQGFADRRVSVRIKCWPTPLPHL